MLKQLKVLLTAVLLVSLGVADAANVVRTVGVLTRNSDGTYDEAYYAGDKPPSGPVLACDNLSQPDATGQTDNVAYQQDVGQYFTGTGKAAATYQLVTVSGDDAAANGWALTGTIGTTLYLHNAGTDSDLPGSGVLKVTGTAAGGGVVDCSLSGRAISWQYQTAPTDTTAPPAPFGATQTSASSTDVTISFDDPSDPDDTIQFSGIASVKAIKLSDSSVLATKSFGPGPQVDWTSTNIGGAAGTNTATQALRGFTLVGGGAGFESASDQGELATTPMTGDQCISSKFTSIDLNGPYNKAMLGFRSGTSTTAADFNAYIMRTGTSVYYVGFKPRNVDGGARSGGSTVNFSSAPVAFKACKSTSGFSMYYQTTAGPWIALVTNYSSLTLPTNYLGYIGTTPTDNTKTATAVIDDVTVTSPVQDTIVVPMVASTDIALKSFDVTGNSGTVGPTITGVPNAPPTIQVKYHQGHYIWDTKYLASSTDYTNNTVVNINDICSNPNIVGIQMMALPKFLEGNTQGDYSAGFALIDDALSRLAACGNKRLMLLLSGHVYGSRYQAAPSVSTVSAAYPSYWLTSTYGTCCAVLSGNGEWQYGAVDVPGPTAPAGAAARMYLRYWSSAVTDRILAIQAAYLARYDGTANFEMFGPVAETAIGDALVDNNSLATQYNRLIDAAAIDGPHTPTRIGINYLGTQTQIKAAYDHCAAAGNCVMGGPDPLYAGYIQVPSKHDAGYVLVYNGTQCSGCTVHDYRSQFRMVSETEYDGIYVHWFIVSGTRPSNCDEAVAAIRAGQESAGEDAAWEIWAKTAPDSNTCYNPSGAQTGILDSINATPTTGTSTKPGNFPDVKTD